MSSKVKQVKCGDLSFNIEKMPATKAITTKARLAQLFSPVLGELPALQNAMTGGVAINKESLASLEALVTRVDADKFTGMLIELCEQARYVDAMGTSTAGDFVKFDEAFEDDLTPAYILGFEIIKFNFEKYLGNVLGPEDQKDN